MGSAAEAGSASGAAGSLTAAGAGSQVRTIATSCIRSRRSSRTFWSFVNAAGLDSTAAKLHVSILRWYPKRCRAATYFDQLLGMFNKRLQVCTQAACIPMRLMTGWRGFSAVLALPVATLLRREATSSSASSTSFSCSGVRPYLESSKNPT